MHTKARLLFVLLVALELTACGPSQKTLVSHTFGSLGSTRSAFRELLVIGVTGDRESRVAFENAFVTAIRRQGGGAYASWRGLPGSAMVSEKDLRGLVERTGSDGVFIARLLPIDKDAEDPKGDGKLGRAPDRLGFVSSGPGWGLGGFYDYYEASFTKAHAGNAFGTDAAVRVETNLYSAGTNSLVWTAQTPTVDRGWVSEFLEPVTASVAKRLTQEWLIR